MRGFLTFTLAAGVAITTTSIAQAAGVEKREGITAKPAAVSQSPLGVGAMGLVLNRGSLTRELERLTELLTPNESTDETTSEPVPTQIKSGGTWLF